MRGKRGVVAALLALVVVLGGWVWLSARTADAVSVTWSPSSPRCSGTTVDRRGPSPVIQAARGMRCVITVQVRNDGPVPVHLDSATAPLAGPGTGTVVVASNAVAGPRSDLDARYDLDRTLGRGERYAFDVLLSFHPSGCHTGGTLWVRGWPRVSTTVLGLSHERRAVDTYGIGHAGPTPGCSE